MRQIVVAGVVFLDPFKQDVPATLVYGHSACLQLFLLYILNLDTSFVDRGDVFSPLVESIHTEDNMDTMIVNSC